LFEFNALAVLVVRPKGFADSIKFELPRQFEHEHTCIGDDTGKVLNVPNTIDDTVFQVAPGRIEEDDVGTLDLRNTFRNVRRFTGLFKQLDTVALNRTIGFVSAE